MQRRALILVTTLALALPLAGCPSDPYDPQTWIENLDDPNSAVVEDAITQLQRLKDPVAIAPLGEAWKKQNRPSSVLRVVVELARYQDEEKGIKPSWKEALPYFYDAIERMDESNPKTIENATIAADALGEARDSDSISRLIDAATKVLPTKTSKGHRARLAAVRALGQFDGEAQSVAALIKVLEASNESQPWNLFAAAAESLADSRSEAAIQPLLETYFKVAHPAVANACHNALIATGGKVVDEAMKIFQGKHKAVNKIAREQQFNIDCDKDMGPKTKCQAPSNLQFKAARLLGDLHATKAAKMLASALSEKPLPAFFPAQATQHDTILYALKRIGEQSVADKVLAFATAADTPPELRTQAIDAYSYLTTSTDALPALAKLVKSEDAVRFAAGMSYARLVRSEKEYEPLTDRIAQYRKDADEAESKADKAEAAFKKAEKEYQEAQEKYASDPKNKKLAKAKKDMESKKQSSDDKGAVVTIYRDNQRTFEQNLVRAYVGVKCKKDPKCYSEMLEVKPDDLYKGLKSEIKDWKKWSDDEKNALRMPAYERALFELAKMGKGAQSEIDTILAKVDSKERILREGCFLVLMQAAPLPCTKCVERLDEVIKQQGKDDTLKALTAQTESVRNYFRWAGT